MFNLMKKDLLLQRKLLLIYFIILCFYLWSDFNAAMSIAIISSLFVINSHYYDEKDSANILLNALPYSRKEIVSSKYIGALLFTGVMIPICILGQILLDSMKFQVSIKDIVLSFLIVMLFTSFYLPFFYKFSQQYILAAFSLIFLLIMIFANKILEFITAHFGGNIRFLMQTTESHLLLFLALTTIICYGLSWILSIIIYEKKAF